MKFAMGMAVAALGVLLPLLLSVTARAQVCSTMCSRYEEGECVEHEQTCVTPAPPSPNFGAIAYSRTSKAWGFSKNWNSRAKAESVAMQNCAQHGGNCEVLAWFDRRCGAVSANTGTGAYWGIGNTVGQAQANAQGECRKDGNRICEVKISTCSL